MQTRPGPSSFDGQKENFSWKEKGHPDTKKWSEEQKEAYLEENKPLIRSVISQVQCISDASISREDLFQEAQIAFWLAFDSYNPQKGTLFTTYAHKCMKNAINEKLRATAASKRRPVIPNISYDSTVTDYGDEFGGGDNMEIPPTALAWQDAPVEEQCIRRETVKFVYSLLDNLFSSNEKYIFLALSQKLATQLELSKELGCSQAKISTTYKGVRTRLFYELQEAGYTDIPLSVPVPEEAGQRKTADSEQIRPK